MYIDILLSKSRISAILTINANISQRILLRFLEIIYWCHISFELNVLIFLCNICPWLLFTLALSTNTHLLLSKYQGALIVCCSFYRCPTTKALGVSYFNFDEHKWGFKFQLPKFQGYNNLYLTCDTYVCDSARDPKPYCDRSCTRSSRRRKRDADADQPAVPGRNAKLNEGPFIINDNGNGPLFVVNSDFTVTAFTYNATGK